MLKRIKTLLLNNLIYASIGITIGILFLSLVKLSGVPTMEIKNIDKAYHGFAYFVLAILWLLTFYKKPEKKYLIVLACIVFGVIIEGLQMVLTAYRTGDLLDVIANTCGTLLALLIFNIFFQKKRVNSYLKL